MSEKFTDFVTGAPAATLAGTEPLPVVSGGVTKQTTPADIAALFDLLAAFGGAPAAGALAGTEPVLVIQAAVLKQTTAAAIAALAASGNPLIAGCTVTGATGAHANDKAITSVTRDMAGQWTIVVTANAAAKYSPDVTPMSNPAASAQSVNVQKTNATTWVVRGFEAIAGADLDFAFRLWSHD